MKSKYEIIQPRFLAIQTMRSIQESVPHPQHRHLQKKSHHDHGHGTSSRWTCPGGSIHERQEVSHPYDIARYEKVNQGFERGESIGGRFDVAFNVGEWLHLGVGDVD